MRITHHEIHLDYGDGYAYVVSENSVTKIYDGAVVWQLPCALPADFSAAAAADKASVLETTVHCARERGESIGDVEQMLADNNGKTKPTGEAK